MVKPMSLAAQKLTEELSTQALRQNTAAHL
jgi:hypothetical protein